MAGRISPPKRIIFTGGSGVIGRHIVSQLLSHGHQILNLDLIPLDNPAVHTMKVDLTDSGQVFNALSSHFNMQGYELEREEMRGVDAVVHFAGLPRNLLVPDNETFRVNVMGTYNVLEAASKLHIPKVILASSQCIYGPTYAQGTTPYAYLPMDESYPTAPSDPYALSKACNEITGAGFVRRFPGLDVYALRIGMVVHPSAYADFALRGDWKEFPGYPVDALEKGKRVAWSYCDVRDLAQIVERCVARGGLGWQVFNCVNGTTTLPDEVDVGSFLRKLMEGEGTEVRGWRGRGERQAPMGNGKVMEMLGFREEWDWRAEVDKARKEAGREAEGRGKQP